MSHNIKNTEEIVDLIKEKLREINIVNRKRPGLIDQSENEPSACVTISFLDSLIYLGLLNCKEGSDLMRDEFKSTAEKLSSLGLFLTMNLPNTGYAKRISSNTVEWGYKGKKALIKHFMIRDNNKQGEDLDNLLKAIELVGTGRGVIVYGISKYHAGIAYSIKIEEKKGVIDYNNIIIFDPKHEGKEEELEKFLEKIKDGYLIVLKEEDKKRVGW